MALNVGDSMPCQYIYVLDAVTSLLALEKQLQPTAKGRGISNHSLKPLKHSL